MTNCDYGVKLAIEAPILINGVQQGTYEGFMLSEVESGELMDVCLWAKLRYDDGGQLMPYDYAGERVDPSHHDMDKAHAARHLLREARKPENLASLAHKFAEEYRHRGEDAQADAHRDYLKEARSP